MVFHRSLTDSKSPQVSRTCLRILAVLSNAVVWIVSTRPPTSKSPRPFNNSLIIVPKAPITIGTIVTFMIHSFFNSLARSKYLSFFSFSFRFILWSAGTAKSTILQIIIIYSFSVFPISVTWWFLTGVWVIASLPKSPGLVSGFWPFLQCCRLDSLYPSANFQVLLLLLLLSFYSFESFSNQS